MYTWATDEPYSDQAVGRQLRLLRKAAHLTQGQLAEQAQVSPSFIGHAERGTRRLSLELAYNLCCLLGVTVDALFAIDKKPAKDYADAETLLQAALDLVRKEHPQVKTEEK